ncbi:MAG: hypothetical protein LAO79_02970 [Acidobacteriia bacterium]|nr:hypothetical protein [Terriglobia bacterium]
MFKAVDRPADYAESFDAQEYLGHLRHRSRFIGAVCLAAGLLALIASVLLPKEYTATATLIIDPPAGNDPRTSITVSPVYLESLRAYETIASSDSLFVRALEKFHLRDERPPESIKRRILKVTKLRDTKILEIAITLPDPKQAQALAQFLAEETVALTRATSLENDNDLLADARNRVNETRKELEQQQIAWREFSVREPYEVLRADLEALTESRDRLQRELLESRAELAEMSARAASTETAPLQARVVNLETQDAAVSARIQEKSARLSERNARADEIQQKLRSAQANDDAAQQRVRELQSSAGLRGERLRVVDPGVVPERPSFPNVGLNVMLAVMVALIGCAAYLALTFRS